MTAGGDILAITNAALQSLNGPGMDFGPPEASSSSHSIFSPLPPKQATNLPLPDYPAATKTQLKSAECSGGGGQYSGDGSPSTLSPLTISARDIEGGSADFTEFCAGSLSFSDGDDLHAAPRNASEKLHYAEMPFTSVGQDRVNFLTPPKGTSSPSVPVRVRVSASKLREIQSPHSSVSSRSAMLSDDSSCGAEGNTPRTLPQSTKEIRNQKYAIGVPVQSAEAPARKSLRQGVLMDKGGPDPTALSFSDDSVIVSNVPAGPGWGQRQSRLKLLEETSQGKNAAPITKHHLSTIPQQVQLVKVSLSHADQKADQKPHGVTLYEKKQSRSVKLATENYQPPKEAPSHTDITETAKLVATCTAAATAALLQASHHTKPPGDEATTAVQSAVEHDHRPASTPKHSLPATKSTTKHSVTKSNVTSHLLQEMDKYGQEEGKVAHSGKQAITTIKQQSQGLKKLHLCNTALGEEGNKLKPVTGMNSTQEQMSGHGAPYCDSCRPKDHRNKPLSLRKWEGKSGCLHPQNYPTTTNPKRHSYHSAPTQNGEADLAKLNVIDAKNDFTSRRALVNAKSMSPRSLTQTELREEAQLMDVLKRVQKLEDYQHARSLEVAKASPISANFRHSSLHSKTNKRNQQRESSRRRSPEAAASSCSDRKSSQSSPPEQPPPKTDPFRETKGVDVVDPLEEDKGVDIVVHAQRVLGKVQSSKRDMELQSELEEAERAFGDFVQALGIVNEDGCQEGIPLKVAEFLSSNVGLASSTAAGEAGSHQPHNVDGVGVGKQRSKLKSRGVMFDGRPSPPHQQHIPVCGSCQHSSSSLPTTTYVTSKSTCLHSHLHGDALVKRTHTPSSLTGGPLQQVGPCHKDKLDTREKLNSSSFPYQLSQPQTNIAVHDMKSAGVCTGALAAAVPLGAPCIMPSPFYDELDSKPGLLSASSVTEPRHSSAERETKVEFADIGLQTSFHSQSEGCEEPGGSKEQLSTPNQSLDEECTSSSSEVDEGMDAVSIVGQKVAPPPASSQQPTPLSPLWQPSKPLEGKSITSEELDRRLQGHLRTQATEWVGRELLARMLSQLQCPLDPLPPHHHSRRNTNSCSTCTPDSSLQDNETAALDSLIGPDGVQKFIDARIPVNKTLILALVKDILKEEVSKIVRELSGRPHSPSQKMDESGDDFSYTPPESGSVVSSEAATPTLSTPCATPPQSPLLEHTPDISGTNDLSLHEDVATPAATPPFSQTEEIEETSLATPQVTEEDLSIISELELHSKSGSSMYHPEDAVCTPSATATPDPVSMGSLPGSQDTLSQPHVQDRSQQVTPIQHTHEPLSESSTTASSSDGGMSSSTSTSGREISAGELLTQRPRVALQAMGTSLSEGEVPYSPGDARWYSLYAATMNKAGLTGWKPKPRRKLDPTMETFLDLKDSPDPSTSDSSQLSEDPEKVYSIGEMRKSKRRPQEDPFKKFLSRLDALSPDSSSTPAGSKDNGSDNTLSEMPSIHHDEAATPATAKHVRQKIQVIPYHQKYPLQKNGRSAAVNILGRLSPGEVPRHIRSVVHQRDDSKEETVWKWATGEVDAKSKVEKEEKIMDNASDHSTLSSPKANTLRDGIDVISISRRGHPYTQQESELDLSLAAANDNIILVQPTLTSSQIEVSEIKSSDEGSELSPIETQARNTSGVAKEAPTDVVIDLEVSDPTKSPNNLESNKLMGTELKPLTVTIPTAHYLNEENLSSISEHVDNSYSSDFEFSSISIPGV